MLDAAGWLCLYILSGMATGFVALFASRKVRGDIDAGRYMESVAGVLLWPLVWLGCLLLLALLLRNAIRKKVTGG